MSEDQPWTHDAVWRVEPPLHLDPLPPRRADGGPAWPDLPSRGGEPGDPPPWPGRPRPPGARQP